MFSPPDKDTLDRLSVDTGFVRDTLEKMYRLIALLGDIFRTPDLENKLALKGGTAIQSLHLGFRRISVDADLNYVGSVEKAAMERDRADISAAFGRLFRQQGYDLEEERRSYAEHTFILAYHNSAGNRDRIKVEANYLERLPVLGVRNYRMHHPFGALGEVAVTSYRPEELFATKTRALVTRATPRDLFDVYLIASGIAPFDESVYRKLLIFYLCMSPVDVRELNSDVVLTITDIDMKRHLTPLLRKGQNRPGLDEMRSTVRSLLDRAFGLTDGERRFLDTFYVERRLDQHELFGDMPVSGRLADHPAILWRLANAGPDRG